MTLRWRLNLSVAAMVAVFLAASAFGMRAVIRHGTLTRLHARMREQSQFTADVRTHVYQQLSASAAC